MDLGTKLALVISNVEVLRIVSKMWALDDPYVRIRTHLFYYHSGSMDSEETKLVITWSYNQNKRVFFLNETELG